MRKPGPWSMHSVARIAAVAVVPFVAACGDERGGTVDSPELTEPSGAPAAWRAGIGSSDPAERAHAVDLLPGAPGKDGLATLERLAIHDEDARVREQAVIAYPEVAGAEGERFLKDVALGDADAAVRSAARAALELLHDEHPRPARAWMNVGYPEGFRPGESFDLRVRFGSSESAPKASVVLRPPKAFEVDDPRALRWRGAVVAGVAREVVFRLTAPREPVEGSVRVRLAVDYPEALDLDVVREHMRVESDAVAGRFRPMPARPGASISAEEVQP